MYFIRNQQLWVVYFEDSSLGNLRSSLQFHSIAHHIYSTTIDDNITRCFLVRHILSGFDNVSRIVPVSIDGLILNIHLIHSICHIGYIIVTRDADAHIVCSCMILKFRSKGIYIISGMQLFSVPEMFPCLTG